MAVNPTTALPCGRDPLDVVDAARSGRLDAHSRACQYCRAVLDDDTRQREIAAELRASATPAPESLLASVMSTVWAELRPGRPIPLGDAGPAFVTELAVNTALQAGLDELPGLEVRTCQARLDDGDLTPGALDVEITVAVAYPADLSARAEDIRRRVQQVLDVQFRLSARTVDVSIDDLYDDREA